MASQIRKLLWAPVLLLAAVPCWGQVKVLQAPAFSNGQSGVTKTLPLNVTPKSASSTIVLGVASTCGGVPTISDTAAHSWVADSNVAGTNGGIAVFHTANTSLASTTVTATLTGSGCQYGAIFGVEATGLSGVVDNAVSNTTGALGGNTFQVGTLVPKGAGDLLVAFASDNDGNGKLSAESGWSFLAATNSPVALEDFVAGAAGNYPVTFGLADTGFKVTGVAVAYSAGGSQPPPQNCTSNGTIGVGGAALSMAPNFTMPTATVGQVYSQSVGTAANVTGGTPPYTYALIGGALPGGLTLSTSGMIAGTPTAAGTFNFSVQVTDSSGHAVLMDVAAPVVGK
jgi:hypothetical protein